MIFPFPHPFVRILLGIALFFATSAAANAVDCPAPIPLGPNPTRLIVIVPATGQGLPEWQSFLARFKSDPHGVEYDWLLYDHGIERTTTGTARGFAKELASCIEEKFLKKKYETITLVGHSVGGMLVRRAYLQSAGAFPEESPADAPWANQVDRIILFTSVNRGVRDDFRWYSPYMYWLLRRVWHKHFVLEDMSLGSDFIADVRIAWIRYFGELRNELASITPPDRPRPRPPLVVQFWGTKDAIVKREDNADLEAFSGDVIQDVAGAAHGNLQRLEPSIAGDADARWARFRTQLFDPPAPRNYPKHERRRVLMVVRGIRDSSGSDWVQYFVERGGKIYDLVDAVEYGYMSAAQFAFWQTRNEHIPDFRDRYAELLAENPLTEFDFIGHSNGTYIFGHSLMSTPSMRFNNVVLAAPVLPNDFDWNTVHARHQIKTVRYDTADNDWPVGILCSFLNALGYSDVGTSGVVEFGEGKMQGSEFLKHVGWYNGDHSAALRYDPASGIDNRIHLLNFADQGKDLTAGEPLVELGRMQTYSRMTKWGTRLLLVLLTIYLFYVWRSRRRIQFRGFLTIAVLLAIIYVALDVV